MDGKIFYIYNNIYSDVDQRNIYHFTATKIRGEGGIGSINTYHTTETFQCLILNKKNYLNNY